MFNIIKRSFNSGSLHELIVFSMLPLSVFAPQSTTFSLCFLTTAFLYELRKKNLLFPVNPLIISVFIFPLLGLLSSCWSLSPLHSVLASLRLFLLSICGLIVLQGISHTSHQTRISRGLVHGFLITLVLLSIEIVTKGMLACFIRGYPIAMFKYNKSICLVVLVLPLLLQSLSTFVHFKIFQKKFFEYLVVVGTGMVIFCLESDACKISYMAGIFLFLIFQSSSLRVTKRILSFIVITCLISPFMLPKIYYKSSIVQNFAHKIIQKPSIYDRLSIWNYTENIIFNQMPSLPTSAIHFMGGFGMNTSKIDIFRTKDRFWSIPNFRAPPSNPPEIIDYQCEAIPLHPHNFILQIFLELGCLGLAIAAYIFRLIIKEIIRSPLSPTSQKFVGISFSISLIISSISFGFWQSWWISSLWLAVFTAQLMRQNSISLQKETPNL